MDKTVPTALPSGGSNDVIGSARKWVESPWKIDRMNWPDTKPQAENDGIVSHLKAILEVFRGSRRRGAFLWLGAGLVLVVGATVYGQIRLNAWSRPFYDALSRKDLSGFMSQLFVFVVIAGALLVLNVAQTWLNQMTKVTLRDELTRDLFAQWLSPRRAFLLAGRRGPRTISSRSAARVSASWP